jgi:hypothetical protein
MLIFHPQYSTYSTYLTHSPSLSHKYFTHESFIELDDGKNLQESPIFDGKTH